MKTGVKKIIPTDEDDAGPPLLSLSAFVPLSYPYTLSCFYLFFISPYSMQPCTSISLSLSLSLAGVQLLCCRLSSPWLRQEQTD